MFDCTDYHVRNLSNIKTCACVSKHFITSIAPIKSQPKIATHNVCKLPLTIICVRSQLCVFQNKDFTTQVVVHSMIQVYYFLSALNIKSWWVFQRSAVHTSALDYSSIFWWMSAFRFLGTKAENNAHSLVPTNTWLKSWDVSWEQYLFLKGSTCWQVSVLLPAGMRTACMRDWSVLHISVFPDYHNP